MAIKVESEFCCDVLSVELMGMIAELMGEYIKFVAYGLLEGCEKFYKVRNPFDWMEMISLEGKANFFERRVGEYQRAVDQSESKANFFSSLSAEVERAGVLTGAGGHPDSAYAFKTEEDF
eukprot:gene31813-7015_t